MDGLDIRIERIRAGLKQYELAKLAGVRETELSMIENGRKVPTADKLTRITNALVEVRDGADR